MMAGWYAACVLQGGTHVLAGFSLLAGWYSRVGRVVLTCWQGGTHMLAGFSLLAWMDLDGEVGEDLLASAVEHVHAERSRE